MRSLLEIVLANSAIATLLAAVAMIAGRYFRRPALVYGLWLLVLLKLMTPPLIRIPVAVLGQETSAEMPAASTPDELRQFAKSVEAQSDKFVPTSDDASTPMPDNKANVESESLKSDPASLSPSPRQRVSAVPPDTTLQPSRFSSHDPTDTTSAAWQSPDVSFPWAKLVLGAWLAGTLIVFATTAMRVLRFCRHVRRPWPTDANLQRQADRLARHFGLSQSPAVKIVNASVPPMLWAMQRSPVILLPRTLVGRLTTEQILTVLAHELAHFRRHDHWVRWLEVFVLGVYWWHPVAWIARRQLQRAEEECCDAWVLWALPDAGAVYARTILETVDFLTADRCRAPVLASGLGPLHVLERRFEMILHIRPAHRVGVFAKCCLMFVALAVLPLSARAQREPPRTEAAPQIETSSALPQNQVPGTAGLPATEPVAQAGPSSAAPAGVEVSAGGPPAANNAAANPFGQSNFSSTPPAIPAGTPALGVPGAVSNNTEDRLARLEKMMQMILAEMHGQPPGGQAHVTWAFRNKVGSTNGAGSGNESVSLSELKKQRIDLEDEMESIKDRMDKIDAQISKLQSARSQNHPSSDSLQAK